MLSGSSVPPWLLGMMWSASVDGSLWQTWHIGCLRIAALRSRGQLRGSLRVSSRSCHPRAMSVFDS
jgi:hypothetical protein